MLEVLDIPNPVEQDLVVTYGERDITIELRWNDTLSQWYINIKENNKYIAPGIPCTALNSNMLYDKFKLGKLYLIDTEQDTNPNPIVKEDLGQRIALVREYA